MQGCNGRARSFTDLGLVGKTGALAINLPNDTPGVGTPGCRAPEVCDGLPHDHKADIYSIGVMLLSLILGESPLRTETREEDAPRLATLLSRDEGLKGISGELREFCAKLCALDPKDRPTALMALCMRYMCGF